MLYILCIYISKAIFRMIRSIASGKQVSTQNEKCRSRYMQENFKNLRVTGKALCVQTK